MSAILLPEYEIAFFSIPKTASTSVKLVLYDLKHGSPWTGDPDKVHSKLPTFPLKAGDIESTQGCWRFIIVRDPVQRLLSSYGNRVHYHRDIERAAARKPAWKRVARRIKPIPTPDELFQNLKRYQRFSYSIWHHTASVVNFVGDDLSVFDQVYRVSDIPRLESDLSNRVGRQIAFPREQTQGQKISMSDLSPRTQNAILKATKADYELLKDYFEPPSGVH